MIGKHTKRSLPRERAYGCCSGFAIVFVDDSQDISSDTHRPGKLFLSAMILPISFVFVLLFLVAAWDDLCKAYNAKHSIST